MQSGKGVVEMQMKSWGNAWLGFRILSFQKLGDYGKGTGVYNGRKWQTYFIYFLGLVIGINWFKVR